MDRTDIDPSDVWVVYVKTKSDGGKVYIYTCFYIDLPLCHESLYIEQTYCLYAYPRAYAKPQRAQRVRVLFRARLECQVRLYARSSVHE